MTKTCQPLIANVYNASQSTYAALQLWLTSHAASILHSLLDTALHAAMQLFAAMRLFEAMQLRNAYITRLLHYLYKL
jgi:hypothetical protein